MGMWWRAAADVLRREGVLPRWDLTNIHTALPLSEAWWHRVSHSDRGPSLGGSRPSVCLSVCVCVTPKGSLPGPPYATHPPSQGEERGGGDPWPLKPPVGPFSQSHAGRAPCLKSHGCLSGMGIEGGGWVGVGDGVIILTMIEVVVKRITCFAHTQIYQLLAGWIDGLMDG